MNDESLFTVYYVRILTAILPFQHTFSPNRGLAARDTHDRTTLFHGTDEGLTAAAHEMINHPIYSNIYCPVFDSVLYLFSQCGCGYDREAEMKTPSKWVFKKEWILTV